MSLDFYQEIPPNTRVLHFKSHCELTSHDGKEVVKEEEDKNAGKCEFMVWLLF